MFLWLQIRGNDQMENLERRQIRQEQDIAYEQMLDADRRRELERLNEARKKKVCNTQQ